MDPQLKPLNVLQLWSLLASGGAQWLSLQRPAIDASPDREVLVSLGLIEVVKEAPSPEERRRIKDAEAARSRRDGKGAKPDQAPKTPKPPKGGAGAEKTRITKLNKFVLTEKGRGWLADHIGDPVSPRAAVPPALLNFLLAGLARLGPGRDVLGVLAGGAPRAFQPQRAAASGGAGAPPKAPGLEPKELLRRIRRLDRGLFMPGGGLRFAELRRALPEFGRGDVDQALMALQKAGDLVLYPFDNPALITEDDRRAVLMVAGAARHYLFLR
jgi:hypothetical protein